MPKTEIRSERIEARIHPETLAVVRRAAEMQGRSLSDFVVAAAEEAARRTIADTQIIRLSVAEQTAFVEMLLNPPPLAASMERARIHHERLVGPV